MGLLLRIAIAVIVGVLVFLVLMFLGLLTQGIDALIGALVGLVVFVGGPSLMTRA
jgi:hypothetical protein